MALFTKREILDNIPTDNDRDKGVGYILTKLDIELEGKELDHLKSSVSTLVTKRKMRFDKAQRKKARFEANNVGWLDSEFHIPELQTKKQENQQLLSPSLAPGPGCSNLDFSQMSDRSKRRQVLQISEHCKHDPLRILMAARCAAQRSKLTDLSSIITKILKTPEICSQMNQLLKLPPSVKPKSAEEALAFLLDNKLSKQVYTNIRLASKSSGADIWPTYNQVREVKGQCRPPKEAVHIDEQEAKVCLQALLKHTVKRIVQMQHEVILQSLKTSNCTETESVAIFSWGFDGSSGQASYKQRYSDREGTSEINDESLFATTCIPLRLTTSTGIILWNNLSSQSERMCRPISLKFMKETSATILKQKKVIEEQIEKLECLVIILEDGYRIIIHFSLHLTLIDGKVLSIITNTKSMQSCPICHATPKQFNDLSNRGKDAFVPNPNSLQFGISPLHAWIRLLELCLNISYRLKISKWQMRSDSEKAEYARRKKEIHNILWEKIGIRVDRPKSGGSGTSNDGNTARQAFQNPELFAECLGLNKQLLKNFSTILMALSSHLPIDPVRFNDLCNATADIYMEFYDWYLMPSTLHKILIHGSAIIINSILPVGMLAEEASEARNKSYKHFREFHSRKLSRLATLEDMFYRSMDSSDPLISTVSLVSRINKRNKLPLPPEVIQLLLIPENESSSSNFKDDENDDNDDCTGIFKTFAILNNLELENEEYE